MVETPEKPADSSIPMLDSSIVEAKLRFQLDKKRRMLSNTVGRGRDDPTKIIHAKAPSAMRTLYSVTAFSMFSRLAFMRRKHLEQKTS